MAIIDQEHIRVTGKEAEFTSIVDGVHSLKSLHYAGHAVDVRRWYLLDAEGFCEKLRTLLGKDYDVVLKANHIHVEFQPKR
jgi:hypothetical protein